MKIFFLMCYYDPYTCHPSPLYYQIHDCQFKVSCEVELCKENFHTLKCVGWVKAVGTKIIFSFSICL